LINTTENTFEVPRGTIEAIESEEDHQHRVNTTAVYDDAEALDENDIVHIVPAIGWQAVYEDGGVEPLAVWVVYEDLTTVGVGLTGGRLDLEQDAEKEGFIRYERTSD